MATGKKKIAVCGGGISGLFTLVALKEEGINAVCFEKTDKPGGTWCYREESKIGVPSIMPTTIINHSKEFGALSNFPPDKRYSNYMRHDQIYEYIMSYANKNDVLKHVQYNTEVIKVEKASDYDLTGRWILTVEDTRTGTVVSNTYDGVIICVGNMTVPKWPKPFKNQELFKGEIIHTHSLKKVDKYENKRVVVVGMGCSALDAAVDISNVAYEVYLSTRSGAHVLNRVGSHGFPLDYNLLRRYIIMWLDILPSGVLSWILENFVMDPKFNSRLFAVQPKWHVLSKDPVLNDHIASKLLSGVIIQKRDIQQFTENGVVFEGDTKVTEIDTVIMATGLKPDFSFLKESSLIDKESDLKLYKCIWPPHLKHPSLAFIGFFLPFGAGFPGVDMSTRYVAHVMAGKGKLPSENEMLSHIQKRCKINNARYAPDSSKDGLRVDYVQFLDELADSFGAKPNFFKMLFTDPKLFFKLIYGPSVPYQYRLQGPHPWEGARDAIMTVNERVLFPLKGINTDQIESKISLSIKKFIMWLLPFT